jgi:DNA-binding NarL/FixJ family response regulator
VRACLDVFRGDTSRPRIVLITGGAGIGKSTVFTAVTADIHPSWTFRAAESERRLPYTALADILGPSLDDALPSLHPVRAEALRSALHLGAASPSAPDARAVANATHDVLSYAVAQGPKVLAIDDVQWLDQESAACIAFALRRLAPAGLGLLLAMRTGSTTGMPLGLDTRVDTMTVLDLQPLTPAALSEIIATHLQVVLPRPTIARLHNMSDGNPLLALELARATPVDAGPDELPTAPDVERLIGRRVRDLNRDTIELLVLAAACPRPTVDVLVDATGLSAHDCVRLLGPEAADGLVDLNDGAIRFTHPLFISAILRSVSPGARVEAHRRLALHTTGAERALHLASAAQGPDEAVAEALQVAADDLAQRGAPGGAASLMERAALLSPDPVIASRRWLRSATLHALAGDGARAARLNTRVVAESPDGPTRAMARANLFTPATTQDEIVAALADARDDAQACALIFWTYSQCAFLRLDLPLAVSSAEQAAVHAERAGDNATLVSATVQVGWIRNLRSPGSGLEALRAAAALPWSPIHAYDSAATKIAMNETAMDDFTSARPSLQAGADASRAAGDDASLFGIALHRVELEVRAGDLRAAREWLRIGAEITSGDGDWQSTHIQDYLEALVLGREGDGAGAVTSSERGLAAAFATGDGAFVSLLEHAAAVGLLQCGRPDAALDHLTHARESCEAVGLAEPGVIRFHGPEIEALIGVGDLERARTRIVELAALGRRIGRPRLVGEAAFGRGLLLGSEQDHSAAASAFREAIDIFTRAALPWEACRAQLALGVALRRGRARAEARSLLADAARTFDEMAAPGWADEARQEAARVSGRAKAEGDLTPIEERIADLVTTGMSNKQVAAELVLAPKTVESHLSHIYAKTGVRSRTELAAVRLGRRPD